MNKKYIYRILVIVWTCVIFSFSLQPAAKSEKLSNGVGQVILEHSSEKTVEKTNDWSLLDWKLFHKIVRKMAHFTEFFILGVCMMLALEDTGSTNKKIMGLLFCILIAATDETIQRFVPGRASRIMDVMIDGSGSLFGIMAYMLLKGMVQRYVLGQKGGNK